MARRGVFDTIMAKDEYMQPEQIAVPIKLPDATTQDPDELIECPYDKIHRIRISRFPMHLLKCRKNYTGKEMFTCPFNARHLVPGPEARHHVANCPDKAAIEKDMLQGLELNNAYCRGYTKVPSYYRQEEYHHKPTENWDDEISRVVPVDQQSLDQEERGTSGGHGLPRPRGRGAPRAVGITQPEMRLPRQPAQAAAVAQQRHQQLQNPQTQGARYNTAVPASVPATTGGPVPAPAHAQPPGQPPMKVAGLGRGQFKGRVMAANLWGVQPQEGGSPNGLAYPPRPGGLGQSAWGEQPAVPNHNGPMMPPAHTEDDFPALGAANPTPAGLGRGLGRGMLLNPVPGLRPTVGMQNGTM